tara:strand:- start:3688 stop:4146 length:459 start_codon:yes stop_codon:yes gene_type:complete
MAKIIFRKNGTSLLDIVALVKTDVDQDYVTGNTPLSQYHFIDISDSDFDAVSVLTKDFVAVDVGNNSATFVECEDNAYGDDVEKDVFTNNLTQLIDLLTKRTTSKPNHSNHSKAVACLDYLKTIDVDSLSYPTTDVMRKILANGTPINVKCL